MTRSKAQSGPTSDCVRSLIILASSCLLIGLLHHTGHLPRRQKRSHQTQGQPEYWHPLPTSSWMGTFPLLPTLHHALLKNDEKGSSLVAQWLRIHLPMQGTRVRALVREDPTCRGATKPVHHNYWACALEPATHNYWACVPQLLSLHSRAHTPHLLKPTDSRARAPQQEKPPQWEARVPQRRVAPARRN